MAQKRRISASANFPGLSSENSAKLRKVVKFVKDVSLPAEPPKEVREMLAVGAADAVRFVTEERHPYHNVVCTYIQECLGSMQAQQKKTL